MTSKKYKKIKCSLCNKPAVLVPSGENLKTSIVCLKCGDKNGKKPAKRTATQNYTSIKGGVRKDIHPTYYFRSAMEANFARILQYINQEFKFEEKKFTFEGYKNKPFSYLPDFYVKGKRGGKFKSGWYETKGWMKTESMSKLRRLRKHYPKEADKMTVVIYRKSDRMSKEFCKKQGLRYLFWDDLRNEFEPLIPTWE
jgi:hypothetical protein